MKSTMFCEPCKILTFETKKKKNKKELIMLQEAVTNDDKSTKEENLSILMNENENEENEIEIDVGSQNKTLSFKERFMDIVKAYWLLPFVAFGGK
jgi:hypothetical protein